MRTKTRRKKTRSMGEVHSIVLYDTSSSDSNRLADEFIAEAEGEGDDEEGVRRTVHHARLDRRDRELNDQDLARIAEDVSQRYKRSAVRYTGDMNEVPQRLLMPSVQDANLWQVRCKARLRSAL
jgi:transcription elongation factor SPT5